MSVLVSIVSHGHGALLPGLLADLAQPGNAESIHVCLTLNQADEPVPVLDGLPYPVTVRRNDCPRGFAANHNAAWQALDGIGIDYVCVLNPDVSLPAGSVSALLARFRAEPAPALVAPAVRSPAGVIEDSCRPLPTPGELVGKLAARLAGRPVLSARARPDAWFWVAGMCMLIDARVFRDLGGFDERYFLYYEDVDLCCRLRLAGHRIAFARDVEVVHDARRDSHRDGRMFVRHLASVLRFFTSPVYRRTRALDR